MVFRALHGRAWVGASGRDTVGIEGSALFVWLVLDEAASADELTERIGELWPELGEIRVAEVQAYREARNEQTTREALSALTDKARRPSDGENNLTAAILTAVKAQATVGEIADALRLVFGEYVG